jgi:cation diffusion facilitator CzcD-associated flavoprotein CzcO
MPGPNIILIGAGPSGIAMAHTLKYKLGFDDFMVYEKIDGVGGTWRTNKYPGVFVNLSVTLKCAILTFDSGCDVPTRLYSFSFNHNPEWSKAMCDGPEILECRLKCSYVTTELMFRRYGKHCRQI